MALQFLAESITSFSENKEQTAKYHFLVVAITMFFLFTIRLALNKIRQFLTNPFPVFIYCIYTTIWQLEFRKSSCAKHGARQRCFIC